MTDIANSGGCDGMTRVWPQVIAYLGGFGLGDVARDCRARDVFGRAKYGTPLQADNGRNHLVSTGRAR